MSKTTRRPWDQSFADFSAWLEAHGRMPTAGGSGDEEKRLAQWVSTQRVSARKGLLPAAQFSRLSALIGDPTRRAGKNHQVELPDWVEANGRLPRATKIPARADEGPLGHRLFRLRRRYRNGTATLHDVELLLAIPGCLEGPERAEAEARAAVLRARTAAVLESAPPVPVDIARWEASFDELRSWVSAHGVPRRRTEDVQEYKVANWLNIQRTHARNNTLSGDREDRLRTIPGALETKETRTTAERIADLASFQAKHGRMPSQLVPEEASLNTFLNMLRHRIRSGNLSPNLAAAAGNVPGVITAGNKAAKDTLQEYTDFVTRHGHVPRAEKDKSLYVWSLKAAAGGAGGAGAPAIQAAVQEIRATFPTHSVWGAVTRFETYIAAHGHLPPDSRSARPQLPKASLHRALGSGATPEPVKDRIRTILAAPAYRQRTAACRLGDRCRA